MRDWRKLFGNSRLHFEIVQLQLHRSVIFCRRAFAHLHAVIANLTLWSMACSSFQLLIGRIDLCDIYLPAAASHGLSHMPLALAGRHTRPLVNPRMPAWPTGRSCARRSAG